MKRLTDPIARVAATLIAAAVLPSCASIERDVRSGSSVVATASRACPAPAPSCCGLSVCRILGPARDAGGRNPPGTCCGWTWARARSTPSR